MYDNDYYYNDIYISISTIEGPILSAKQNTIAFKRKNSNQFDIYSYAGKLGTVTVPIDPIQDVKSIRVLVSRSMLDNDDGWELIVNYSNNNNIFKVYDDDLTELISDTGYADYGFDGKNTYIVTGSLPNCCQGQHIKAWQFRNNIQNASSQNLAKKTASQSPIQIIGYSGGDYRVRLSPTNGSHIDFQMFDLMGRCVFAKKINNLTSPVTFTVHENNIPASPFITKVSDGEENYYKRQILVR